MKSCNWLGRIQAQSVFLYVYKQQTLLQYWWLSNVRTESEIWGQYYCELLCMVVLEGPCRRRNTGWFGLRNLCWDHNRSGYNQDINCSINFLAWEHILIKYFTENPTCQHQIWKNWPQGLSELYCDDYRSCQSKGQCWFYGWQCRVGVVVVVSNQLRRRDWSELDNVIRFRNFKFFSQKLVCLSFMLREWERWDLSPVRC